MENNITGIDKISDLPDALLTHILSFVSPIEAVQTCILSKRWRRTWASVPVLKFYLEKFVPADEVSSSRIRELHENEARMREYHIKLKKFVKRVLQNRERSLSLDTFKLRLDFVCNQQYYYTYPFAIKYIVLALKSKPRVFSVHVHWHVRLVLYCIEPIFTCASLQKISLGLKCLNRSMAKVCLQLRAVNLPRLKRLKLGYVGVDDKFLKMLFLGCPALEELKLSSCHLHASLLFSEVLKSLVLECCHFEKNLVISTPSLVYFDINHTQRDGRNFSLENMASLVDAQIEYFSVLDDAGLNMCNHVSKFSMSDQSALSKVMRKEVPNVPNFKKLKSLQLGGHRSNLFNLVAIFLLMSPNLRKLSLRIYPPYWSDIEEKSNQEEWRDVLPLREYLEEVEIVNYYKVSEEIVGQVIKKLSALVKTIGKIILKKSVLD